MIPMCIGAIAAQLILNSMTVITRLDIEAFDHQTMLLLLRIEATLPAAYAVWQRVAVRLSGLASGLHRLLAVTHPNT